MGDECRGEDGEEVRVVVIGLEVLDLVHASESL